MKPILIVIDDEVDILESYVELFNDSFDVKTFEKASVFLSECENNLINMKQVNLILTDYNIEKGITGLDVIQKVRSLQFDFPYILMSGYVEQSTQEKAQSLGEHLILEKPFDLDMLVTEVNRLSQQYREKNMESFKKVS